MNENNYCNRTSINTRINSKYRISSIWREFSNTNLSEWAWETFVWEKDGEEERICRETNTYVSVEPVLQLHVKLYEEFKKASEKNN